MSTVLDYFITDTIPPYSSYVLTGMIITGVVLAYGLLAPVTLALLRKRSKAATRAALYVKPLSTLALPMGLLGLLLWFLRYESIAPFNRRIWVYAWALALMIGVLLVDLRQRKRAPGLKRQDTLEVKYRQYLPQKRKGTR